MKVFEIERELPDRRAIVEGPLSELQIDTKVVVVDDRDNEYDAVVETRFGGGAVVRVTRPR